MYRSLVNFRREKMLYLSKTAKIKSTKYFQHTWYVHVHVHVTERKLNYRRLRNFYHEYFTHISIFYSNTIICQVTVCTCTVVFLGIDCVTCVLVHVNVVCKELHTCVHVHVHVTCYV